MATKKKKIKLGLYYNVVSNDYILIEKSAEEGFSYKRTRMNTMFVESLAEIHIRENGTVR